jgi:hypothetical protein
MDEEEFKSESASPLSLVLELMRGVDADLGHYHGLHARNLALFPLAVASSIAPPNPAATHANPPPAEFRISYLPRAPQLWPLGLIALLALALLVGFARRDVFAWPIARGCAAILGWYWVLHLFFGDELFLYALHWQVPLMLLIGAAAVGARTMTAGIAFMVVLIAIAAVRSAVLIPLLLRQWAAAQAGS